MLLIQHPARRIHIVAGCRASVFVLDRPHPVERILGVAVGTESRGRVNGGCPLPATTEVFLLLTLLIQTTEICPLLVPPIENATRRWVGERVDAGGDGSLSLPLARGSRQRQGPESRQHARDPIRGGSKKGSPNARCPPQVNSAGGSQYFGRTQAGPFFHP